MLELSSLILNNYQVRKTKVQKTAFINLLKEHLKDNISIEEGGLFKSRNIIVGDIHKAKVILTAHYDTQPILPFPNFLTPKNLLIYLVFNIFVFLYAMILDIIFLFIVGFIFKDATIMQILNYIFCAFMVAWMFIGKANKHTANDNTSGVITLIEAINANINDDIAYVFFDHEEVGLLGSALFAKMHRDIINNKLVINFDCVGDGDYLMFILNQKLDPKYQQIFSDSFKSSNPKEVIITSSKNTLYPSDQINFKQSVGVAAFKKHRFIGYYLDKIHTAKDTNLDYQNIQIILDGLKQLMINL